MPGASSTALRQLAALRSGFMGAEKHEERVACLFRINTVLTQKAVSFECV
jgi:hypothetical protein